MNDLTNRHYLAALFEPSSVAIIGASERTGSVGAVLLQNMLDSGYKGKLFVVNPKYQAVRGIECYASIDKLPQCVDLAVVATPAPTVHGIIDDCGRAGVPAAVVITAGFSETGPQGAALEQSLLANARRHRIRVLGPNCLGIMRPAIGLNATFARGIAHTGTLGLISQSGAVCTALLDWAAPNRVGFSSIVSLGGSTDVDFGEIIDYLVMDPATEHILLYIEGVRNARRFVSALRAAARVKPVILMKVGRFPAGSRAAMSHTGTLVGSDDVFDAVVRRTGTVRVQTIGQLVAAAQALVSRIRPQGERLVVITNGGGPGVMAADYSTQLGLPLASLTPATVEKLQQVLPATWSHGNPVDLIGDASAERYRAAVMACLDDSGVDGALVILTPQAMTNPIEVAEAVIAEAHASRKPLLACWMGEQSVASARRLLAQANIPVFRTPEPAVEMFAHISAFYRNQRTLLQTPGPLQHQTEPDIANATKIIEAALAERRGLLSEMESKALLAAFRIPVPRTLPARSENEAVMRAQELGFPVVMKIDSPDITHKSDVGGVQLNLSDAHTVRVAYARILENVARAAPQARVCGVNVESMLVRKNARELMVGVIRDAVFGPAIAFGAGGTTIEILHDRAIDLPPLNADLAAKMIRSTRVSRLLGAYRNLPPINMAALESILLRVSEMACELPWIEELDINPLIVDKNGAVAVDARIVIAARDVARTRYAHLAIHPYPAQLVQCFKLADGTEITLRPIRPEDADIEQEFVKELSATSRYFRFMGTIRELTPSILARFTQIDYDREMAFVAVRTTNGREEEIAVARYVTNPDGQTCEFAVVVADKWQRRGLGLRLMKQLINVARERAFRTMISYVMSDNIGMLALCSRLGFIVALDSELFASRRVILPLAAE